MSKIALGYCQCGCGKKTKIALTTNKWGKKGEPNRFLRGHTGGNRKGKNHPGWKGGRCVDGKGYILILQPEHHRADYHGYVREHVLVAEKMLGRLVTKDEIVHHLNGVRNDNRPENLKICKNRRQHTLLHQEEKCRKCKEQVIFKNNQIPWWDR